MKVKIGPYKDNGKERKIEVKIDNYDTWSADHTLSYIILPMLKQLKKTTHGSPLIDNEDVPKHLQYITTEYWYDQRTFEFYEEDKKAENQYWKLHHKKWVWVMNEMIWAFTQIRNGDGDDKFFNKNNELIDKEGLSEYHKRIDNGTRLFGKYYRGLWD